MGSDAVRSAAATLLTAEEAARRLGVRRATLYAYVSRGLLAAVPDALDPHASRYSSFEIDLLARRKGRRKGVEHAMAAIIEGRPILETGLSCIHEGRPIYRGQSAIALAQTATVEDVARLLWQCDPHDPFAAAAPVLGPSWSAAARGLRRRPVQERSLVLLAMAQSTLNGPSWLVEPSAQAIAAGEHLRAAVACFLAQPPDVRPLHEQCRRAWRLPPTVTDALRAALVLAADHEMNMVAFVGRCLTSVGASMGAALLAAMCNVDASLNGGDTPRVEALWDELLVDRDLESAVARRLASGNGLPGFNHLAYPTGDPRAQMLLDVAAKFSAPPRVIDVVARLAGWKPTIAFGFVALRRAIRAPQGAALTLQMAGRCTGVIAHILEQRSSGQRIMPRARYVGPIPVEATIGRSV